MEGYCPAVVPLSGGNVRSAADPARRSAPALIFPLFYHEHFRLSIFYWISRPIYPERALFQRFRTGEFGEAPFQLGKARFGRLLCIFAIKGRFLCLALPADRRIAGGWKKRSACGDDLGGDKEKIRERVLLIGGEVSGRRKRKNRGSDHRCGCSVVACAALGHAHFPPQSAVIMP